MAKISTLIENFNDDLFPASFTDNAGSNSNVSGEKMRISKGGGAAYQTILSVAAYDLDESSIYDQVVDAGDQSNASNEMYPMRLVNSVDTSDTLEWGIFNGVLTAFYRVNGSMTTLRNNVSYNAAVHKWFRIRETGGTTFWDYSTDGVSWTNYTSVATPAGVTHTSLKVELSVGSWDSAPDTTAVWDNINFTPVTSVAKLFGVAQANIARISKVLVTNVAKVLGVANS